MIAPRRRWQAATTVATGVLLGLGFTIVLGVGVLLSMTDPL